MSEVTKLFPYIMDRNESDEDPSSETQYYMNMFRAYDGFPRFSSWNWSAFFFSSGWFLYRKMYLYSVLALLVQIQALYEDPAISLPFYILCGIFGNAIYRHELENRAKSNSRKKGTSSLLAFVYAVAIVAFGVFLEIKKHGIQRFFESILGTS